MFDAPKVYLRGRNVGASTRCGSATAQIRVRGVTEEIIVTADRVAESARKIPLAINAFDELSIAVRWNFGNNI